MSFDITHGSMKLVVEFGYTTTLVLWPEKWEEMEVGPWECL